MIELLNKRRCIYKQFYLDFNLASNAQLLRESTTHSDK